MLSERIRQTETRSGRLDRVRIAVPENNGRYVLYLDGEPLIGQLDADAGHTAANLRHLASSQPQATVGLFVLSGGWRRVHWVLTEQGDDLLPLSLSLMRKRAVDGLWRWLPPQLAAVALTAFAIPHWDDSVLWGLLAMFAGMAMLMLAILSIGHVAILWSTRRRHWLASERELGTQTQQRDWTMTKDASGNSKRIRAAPAPTAGQSLISRQRATRPGAVVNTEPRLERVEGVLKGARLDQESTGGGRYRLDFGVYRFAIGGRSFALYAGRGLGAAEPFLAEGDRVELVAERPTPSQTAKDTGERLVYALRNLEDNRTYVSHSIFRAQFREKAMILFTPRVCRQVMALVSFMASILFAMALWLDGPPWREGVDSSMFWVTAVLALFLTATVMVPVYLSRLAWRLGHPNPSQALTDRVYTMLSLGPPLAKRPPDLHEV